MSFEKDVIDRELTAVRKEISKYRDRGNLDMVIALEHFEKTYLLLYKIYKVKF